MMALRILVGFCLLAACYGFDHDYDVLNVNDKLRYTDCDDVVRKGHYKHDGIYSIYLNGSVPLKVRCRYDQELNATAVVIMQQKYGHVNFQLGWKDYEHGFGSIALGDYWVGLHAMQGLTSSGYHTLRVTLQDWGHTIKTLQYNYFFLAPASQRYTLNIGGYVSSHVLPDDFSHNNGMPFATLDRPDIHNCALNQRSGWWYNYCTYTLPTGRYYIGGHYTPSQGFYDGIYYKDWLGFGYSLKYIKMELVRLRI